MRYSDVAERYLGHDYRRRLVYRGVYPSWDNTARVLGRGLITLDSTPENFERWLNRATNRTLIERKASQRLVFINAWNEWAEGCHLEPDQRYGFGFLEATLRVKQRRSLLQTAFHIPDARVPGVVPEARPLIRRIVTSATPLSAPFCQYTFDLAQHQSAEGTGEALHCAATFLSVAELRQSGIFTIRWTKLANFAVGMARSHQGQQ